MLRLLSRLAALLLLLVGVGVIVMRSHVREEDDFDEVLEAARQLRELDARLDTAVLEAKGGLSLDYDTLSSTLREMNATQEKLAAHGRRGSDAKLDEAFLRTSEQTRSNERLVDDFETASSISKNSLTYIALAAKNLQLSASASKSGTDLRIHRELNALLSYVIACTTACDDKTLERLERSVEALTHERASLSDEGDKTKLDAIVRHGRVLVRGMPAVEHAVRRLTSDNGHAYSELYVVARARRDAVNARANIYRRALIALTVALVALVGVMIQQLRKKQRELAGLNQSLERRVEERTSELSSTQREYKELLETTHAIPWGMAPGSLRFTYVGPQATRLVGFEASEWLREGFLEERLHPDDTKRVKAKLLDLRDGAQTEVEMRMVVSKSREVWLRAIVSASADASGELVRRGVLIDVTARRELEAELHSAQKLESLGRLSAGIAHEINTPIQFVSDSVSFIRTSFVELAKVIVAYRHAFAPPSAASDAQCRAEQAREVDEEADTDYVLENVPSALDAATDGLARIALIVRSLKDFSHPDRTDKSAVDLELSIRSTLTIAKNEYKDVADVDLQLSGAREDEDERLPLVVCHAGEINQVLLNLIVNAAHAIGAARTSAGERGKILIRTWRDGAFACVAVADTGGGIPEAIRGKIFDPFFTTKDVGQGTGQGLALARKIVVDKHHGELSFETSPHGTEFVMRLPISGSERAPRSAKIAA